MKWNIPPIIKIYEALGSVADSRVEVSENSAKVYSSSRNKFYEVSYDPERRAIMANDNASYWKGYLGYPSIAFLLVNDTLEYREELGNLLKNIAWKDINQKFKNDFDKTLEYILSELSSEDKGRLREYANSLLEKIKSLDLSMLGKRTVPPKGY